MQIVLSIFILSVFSQIPDEEIQILNYLLQSTIGDIETQVYSTLGPNPVPSNQILSLSDRYGLDPKTANYQDYENKAGSRKLDSHSAELKDWIDTRDRYNHQTDSLSKQLTKIAIVNELKSNGNLIKNRKHIGLNIRKEHIKITDEFFSSYKAAQEFKPTYITDHPPYNFTFDNYKSIISSASKYSHIIEFTRVVINDRKNEACVYVKSKDPNGEPFGTLYVLEKKKEWRISWQYYFIAAKGFSP